MASNSTNNVQTSWFNATELNLTKRFRLGTMKKDYNNNLYVYLAGVASNVAGAWVSYNSVAAATAPVLVVAGVTGPLAISMVANTSATNYSWYQVFGNNLIAQVPDNGPAPAASLYTSASAGVLDDATSTGNGVIGAMVTVQAVTAGSTGIAGVYISYPFLTNGASKT